MINFFRRKNLDSILSGFETLTADLTAHEQELLSGKASIETELERTERVRSKVADLIA
jgi:hypothetical protein